MSHACQNTKRRLTTSLAKTLVAHPFWPEELEDLTMGCESWEMNAPYGVVPFPTADNHINAIALPYLGEKTCSRATASHGSTSPQLNKLAMSFRGRAIIHLHGTGHRYPGSDSRFPISWLEILVDLEYWRRRKQSVTGYRPHASITRPNRAVESRGEPG